MKKLILLAVFVLCVIGVSAQAPRDSGLVTGKATYKNLSVVKIISGSFDDNRNFQRSLAGSGVIIDRSGIVVTSRSVVFPKGGTKEFNEIWTGVVEQGRTGLRPNQAYRLHLIAQSEQLDIALLKIELKGPGHAFTAMSFSETGNLGYGQELNVVGFMQANGTAAATAEANFLDYDEKEDLLKIEGSFLKGIAGGAVVDGYGRLVGIPVRIAATQSVPFFNQENEEVGQISIDEVAMVVPAEAIQGFIRKVPELVNFTVPDDLRKNVRIEGAVNDKSTNQPVQWATIGILLPNVNSRQYIDGDELIAYARTDSRGAFTLNRRIKPGTYSVKVVHRDYRTEYKTIQVPAAAGRLLFLMTKE
jgi:S1-C subfamily serine protease